MDDPTPVAERGGYSVWVPTEGVAFVGRGPDRPRRRVLAAATGVDRPVAWVRQMHGSRCVEARAGRGGDADALTTSRRDLAIAISTADCVPIAILATTRAAVIHAGWRGIVAGVVPPAVASLAQDPETLRAWLGPAIGPCCYEVGADVAEQVRAASRDAGVLSHGDGGRRPHLDLRRAVASQLRAAGLRAIHATGTCTRCDPGWHSHRRDGLAAGRNLAFAWLPAAG